VIIFASGFFCGAVTFGVVILARQIWYELNNCA
jgi:hypothetical protein